MPRKQKIQVVTIAENQLLLLQFAKFHKGGFQNITGSVEKDESFQEAAERELLEETGLIERVQELDLIFHFNDRWGNEVDEKVFVCALNKILPIKISEEHQGYKWVPADLVTERDFVFPSNYEAFKKALESIK